MYGNADRRGFRTARGDGVHATAGDGVEALHFTLVEANPLKVSNLPEGARSPFELVFREAGPTLYQQGLDRLVHSAMGEHDTLIVQNAHSEADGATYSSTFN